MANFIISVDRLSTPPTVSSNSANLSDVLYTFKTIDFTTDFTDTAGDSYENVIIKSLPTVLQLKSLGQNAIIGTEFHADNASGLKFYLQDNYAIYAGILYQFTESITSIINQYDLLGYKLTDNTNGRLEFTDLANPTDIVFVQGQVIPNTELQFNFVVKDNSQYKEESNLATFSLIPSGDVNIKSLYVNNPPTIGDNTISTKYDETIVFTSNDFVEDTDPRFSDPEGDQPYQLKILSLPANGTLYLRGIEVIINQELLFVGDIDQAVFTYTPDSTRTDIASVVFDFTVNDTGSKIYA